MKVLHITPDFPSKYFVGGQGLVVLQSSLPLVRKGIEVSILTARSTPHTLWKQLEREETIDGIHVIRLETGDWPKRLFGLLMQPPVLTPMGFFQALPHLVKSDILHFHNFWFGGFVLPLFFVAHALGKKIIFSPYYENFAMLNPREGPSFYRFLEILAGKAWRTTVISEREKWKLLEFTDRITKIPLGIDREKVRPPDTRARDTSAAPPSILTVGNACERKNYTMLIEALADVPQPWKLVIKSAEGADKHYTQLCREKADHLGLEKRIEWITRRLSDAELSHLYGSASLFVMPSLWESFSLTALEAMAHGVPSILSEECMISEYFEPNREILVANPYDTTAWSGAIRRLLEDTEFSRDMASRARKKITDYFTWGRVADDLLEIYRAALTGQQLGSARDTIDPRSVSSCIYPGHAEDQLGNGWLPREGKEEFLMRDRSSFLLRLEDTSEISVTAGTDGSAAEIRLQLTVDEAVLGETPVLLTEEKEHRFRLPPPSRQIGCGVLRAKWAGAICPKTRIRRIEAG